uniref:hypothetical protein n=1 Tax=Rhodococcus qingshengii TaxID=334542 RepID=UPI001C4DDD97
VPIPVDDKGIDVATGIDTGPAAKIAVVTPSHQFPLGTTMALDSMHSVSAIRRFPLGNSSHSSTELPFKRSRTQNETKAVML